MWLISTYASASGHKLGRTRSALTSDLVWFSNPQQIVTGAAWAAASWHKPGKHPDRGGTLKACLIQNQLALNCVVKSGASKVQVKLNLKVLFKLPNYRGGVYWINTYYNASSRKSFPHRRKPSAGVPKQSPSRACVPQPAEGGPAQGRERTR